MRAQRAEANIEIKWWSQTESNRRPLACHASALPTELWPHILDFGGDRADRPTDQALILFSGQIVFITNVININVEGLFIIIGENIIGIINPLLGEAGRYAALG